MMCSSRPVTPSGMIKLSATHATAPHIWARRCKSDLRIIASFDTALIIVYHYHPNERVLTDAIR